MELEENLENKVVKEYDLIMKTSKLNLHLLLFPLQAK